ncbi:MAG: thioredoxin domain-containing protein [Pseudomonadota bacterium]
MDRLAFLRKRMAWVCWIAAAGVADSVWLLLLHQSKNLPSICAVSSRISCEIVRTPFYSRWFGVPVPVFSILFYVFVLLLAASARNKEEVEIDRPVIYLWLFSLLALASTVYMGWVSVFVLKALCPFCAVLYLVSFAYAWTATRALRKVSRPWLGVVFGDLATSYRSPWILGAVIAGIAALFLGPRLFKEQPYVEKERREIAPVANRSLGAPNAPITLACFSDFQCPYCRVAGEVLEQVEALERGRVKVIYKFFPLDESCNRAGGSHPLGCKAALAAYCASAENRFWPYHDLLFSVQDLLKEADFVPFARSLNLDLPAFERCLADPASLEAIRKDIEEGIRLGVNGTPTVFINGQRYTGPLTVAAIEEFIPR